MKKATANITALLIAVLLVAVLSIRLFFRGKVEEASEPPAAAETAGDRDLPGGAEGEAEPEAEAPPEETPAETPPEETPAPTPVPTAPPTPGPAPAPTPPPTPQPAPAPTPQPAASASGSFSSATGTSLNLTVSWRSYTDGSGSRKLQVDLSAVSYSINCSANPLELTVNGVTYTKNGAALSYSGEAMRSSPLGSFTVDAPAGNASITAVWHYKGSYSGVALDSITASGIANIP